MSEIAQALKPFSTFAEHAIENVNGTWVWENNTQNERICDWFGPSDFGAALSSAAVAEREPLGYVEKSDVEQLKAGNSVVVYLSDRDSLGVPIYLDPPPTSELEAENARLTKDRDDFKDEWQAELEKRMEVQSRLRVTEARLAEALKALGEAREVVDACAGDNRPARAWAVTVRDGIDAVLAARRVREGGKS